MKNIFNSGNCLSEEQIVRYAQGKSDHEERHTVEHHLLECELCNDALEGIQFMSSPEKLINIKAELHENILNFSNKKEEVPVKVLFPYRIAAAFALIFISGLTLWLILPKQDTSKLFTQEFKPFPAPEIHTPVDMDESPNSMEVPSTEKINKKTTAVKVEHPVEAVKSENILEESKDVNSSISQATNEKQEVMVTREIAGPSTGNASDDGQTQAIDFNKSANKKAEAENAPIVTGDVKLATTETVTLSKISKSPTGSAVINTNNQLEYNAGMDAYQKGNYQEAINQFNTLPNNANALFYCGVSYLSIENPIIAIKKFEQCRKLGANNLKEASYWYEALANIKIENKKAAKKCLTEVVKMNGEYREKAEQLLQKL